MTETGNDLLVSVNVSAALNTALRPSSLNSSESHRLFKYFLRDVFFRRNGSRAAVTMVTTRPQTAWCLLTRLSWTQTPLAAAIQSDLHLL